MNKWLLAILTLTLAVNSWAADTVFRGDSKDAKDAVAYFKGGCYYSDAACKQLIYHHPGNMVAKEKPAKPQNAIYRLMSDKIYKGFSINKKDCLATIVVSETAKGNVVQAKVYEGFAMARDGERTAPKPGVELWKDFVVTRDGKLPEAGMMPESVPVLFTIKDNKIYKGDETKECVLTLSAPFNSSRLLFMCVELAKAAK